MTYHISLSGSHELAGQPEELEAIRQKLFAFIRELIPHGLLHATLQTETTTENLLPSIQAEMRANPEQAPLSQMQTPATIGPMAPAVPAPSPEPGPTSEPPAEPQPGTGLEA